MKFFLDTEFIEGTKQRRVLGLKVGPPVPTIDLISIGLVAEDGREYYALNAECELEYAWANEWVRENVLRPIWNTHAPSGMRHTNVNYFGLASVRHIFQVHGKTKRQIAEELQWFVSPTDVLAEKLNLSSDTAFAYEEERTIVEIPSKPTFYGYYCDYDWVVFCQLFGTMMDLPKGFPMYCRDLKQELDRLGMTPEMKKALCPDPVNEHNALADARWIQKLDRVLPQYEAVHCQSEDSKELGQIRRLLHVPALGSNSPAKKVELLLGHVQRAARGEKISNKPEDYY